MITDQVLNDFAIRAAEIAHLHDVACEASFFQFDQSEKDAASQGDWTPCALQLRAKLECVLVGTLASSHQFAAHAHVRQFDLPHDVTLLVAIMNQQGAEWYGTENAAIAFDFILERERGTFDECKSFLDIGGHQMVWATYYGLVAKSAVVTTVEPSLINVLIGLFNLAINGVLNRTTVIPFAVSTEDSGSGSDTSTMLVDFMTLPLRTQGIAHIAPTNFDFVKTDIEGYEYELLHSPRYTALLRASKSAHFELHLGHLIKRGISKADCIGALRAADLHGHELYSQREMYEFLDGCDKDGFFSFVLNSKQD